MPNLSMECYRGIRPAVDFCRALDHVLRIKTLWLKSYLLRILETLLFIVPNKLKRKRKIHEISFIRNVFFSALVLHAYQIEFSIFLSENCTLPDWAFPFLSWRHLHWFHFDCKANRNFHQVLPAIKNQENSKLLKKNSIISFAIFQK